MNFCFIWENKKAQHPLETWRVNILTVFCHDFQSRSSNLWSFISLSDRAHFRARVRVHVRARVCACVRVRALCHHNIISSLLTSQPPNISQVSGVERNHFLEQSESGSFSSSHCHVFTLKDQDQSEVLKYVMSSFSVWKITFYVIHITLLPGLLFKHCVPQKVPPPQFEYSWCSSVHNSPEFPFNII